jgi:hypothetical protein
MMIKFDCSYKQKNKQDQLHWMYKESHFKMVNLKTFLQKKKNITAVVPQNKRLRHLKDSIAFSFTMEYRKNEKAQGLLLELCNSSNQILSSTLFGANA